MDIIEKETIKEVPVDGCYDSGWGYNRRNINGKANAGLTLGIIGTALGAIALFGNNRNGLSTASLFGSTGSNGGTFDGANININGYSGMTGYANGITAPSAFQAWEKSCEDRLALQSGLYDWALTQQNQRFNDRQTLDAQLFSLYKGQTDADFGLYKATRDGIDAVINKQNNEAFSLYKFSRDSHDELADRISKLETKQAVNDAVDPWRAKVLQMQINGVASNANAAVALEAERRSCADNKIVNYANNTFYPIEVMDLTVGTTATPRTVYNPLCGCCCNQNGLL